MEGASDCRLEAANTETPAAEQPPAGAGEAGEARNAEPQGEPLLSGGAGTAQTDVPPGEGLGHHEAMENGEQGVCEPDGPFSASPEHASPVTVTSYSTLLELRNSEREKETSQNAVLSENVTSSTATGKELLKMLDISSLRRFFSST